MGSQLLQNTEIIKQTDYYFGKSEEYMDLSRIYLAVFLFRKLRETVRCTKIHL